MPGSLLCDYVYENLVFYTDFLTIRPLGPKVLLSIYKVCAPTFNLFLAHATGPVERLLHILFLTPLPHVHFSFSSGSQLSTHCLRDTV